MAKTHYAYVEWGNESDPTNYWSDTICGIEDCESPMTNRPAEVTCKKCINKLSKYEWVGGELVLKSINPDIKK